MSEGKTSLSKRGSPSDRDEMPRWMSEDMLGFSKTARDGQRADNDDQREANVACIHTVIPALNASSPSYAVITWKPVLCTGSSPSNSQSEFCSSMPPDDYQVGYQWNAILDFKLTNHIWQNCPG